MYLDLWGYNSPEDPGIASYDEESARDAYDWGEPIDPWDYLEDLHERSARN